MWCCQSNNSMLHNCCNQLENDFHLRPFHYPHINKTVNVIGFMPSATCSASFCICYCHQVRGLHTVSLLISKRESLFCLLACVDLSSMAADPLLSALSSQRSCDMFQCLSARRLRPLTFPPPCQRSRGGALCPVPTFFLSP